MIAETAGPAAEVRSDPGSRMLPGLTWHSDSLCPRTKRPQITPTHRLARREKHDLPAAESILDGIDG